MYRLTQPCPAPRDLPLHFSPTRLVSSTPAGRLWRRAGSCRTRFSPDGAFLCTQKSLYAPPTGSPYLQRRGLPGGRAPGQPEAVVVMLSGLAGV